MELLKTIQILLILCIGVALGGLHGPVQCRPWNPCNNGGQQVSWGGSCYCQCPQTHQGPTCEVPTRPPPPPTQPPTHPPQPTPVPCRPYNPCNNGGHQVQWNNQCYCQCPQTHQGPSCQVPTRPPPPPTHPPQPTPVPCRPYNPCNNGGHQVQWNNNCYCQCPQTHQGPSCEVPTRPPPPPTQPPTHPPQPTPVPCRPYNPCNNGGHQVSWNNQCYCQCPRTHAGPSCEVQLPVLPQIPQIPQVPELPQLPQLPAHPSWDLGSWNPSQQQQQQQGACNPSPCQNGGQCVELGRQSFRCRCNGYWGGHVCQIAKK